MAKNKKAKQFYEGELVELKDAVEVKVREELYPVYYEELEEKEKTLFTTRLGVFDETDFVVLDGEACSIDPSAPDCFSIPPLEGSISAWHEDGCLCPYIFMSMDEEVFKTAMECPYTVQHAVLRRQAFDNGQALFFVGFTEVCEAEVFLYTLTYNKRISGRVTYNGHKVMCGQEVMENTI